MKNIKNVPLINAITAAMVSSAITAIGFFEVTNNNIEQINLQHKQVVEEQIDRIEQIEKDNNKMSKELSKVKTEIKSKDNQIKDLESKLNDRKELPTSSKGYTIDIKLTYYSALPEENGGYTVTCTGAELEEGMVASNHYPLGTKIVIHGKTFTVSDRGSKRFKNPHRLDVLVERNYGESDSQYSNRVTSYGVTNVSAQVYEQ